MDKFRARFSSGIAAGAFALCVALFAWLSGNSEVFPPELWDELAVAAGIRPPQSPFPGFWRSAVSQLVAGAGLERTIFLLRALGPVSLGLLALSMYIFLGEVLPLSLRRRLGKWGWSRGLVRLVLMLGSLCFVLSSPVWRAGRTLSPDMLMLLAWMGLLLVFCHALRRGRPFLAMLMSAMAGLFAAETAFAFALPFAFAAFVRRRLKEPGVAMDESLGNPLLRYLTFRRMSVLFFLSWTVGVYVNSRYFWAHDGIAAQEWSRFSYFPHYMYGYVQEIASAALPMGWVSIAIAVVAPFVISVSLAGRATDDAKFLSYVAGLFFLVAGAFSFVQSTGWASAWFWCWGESTELVRSQFLLCVCLFMAAVTSALSLCVVFMEFYFRNDGRVAHIRYEDNVMAATNWNLVVRSSRRVRKWVRVALACVPGAALALMALPKASPLDRDMSAVVNDCAWQTAAECGTAGLLFSDGMIDAAVEVAAARQGRKLKVLSMVAGSTPYERYIRARGEADEEDRNMMEMGASNTLRTWVGEKQDRAADIAVQLGLELWLRNGLEAPEFGGLVSRTAGFPEGERVRWIADARRLAERALSVHAKGDVGKLPYQRLVDQFSSVEWRIERMCQLRADADDRGGRAEAAMAETELADRLDDCNVSWGRVRERTSWAETVYDTRLTPRDGLVRSLRQGDFLMARMYARQILHANPGDSSANFAMGMSYFVEEKYNRAETYLKRSLEARPDEPAALNNLAIVQVRLGKYDEAETNAVRALSHLPDSKAVKGTLRYVRKLLSRDATPRDATL